MYKFLNVNQNNNFVNDCVVRAISVAENKSWGDTYDDLSRIAKKNGIYVLKIAGHVTVIKNKTLYDIWNCKRKTVGNYWRIKF